MHHALPDPCVEGAAPFAYIQKIVKIVGPTPDKKPTSQPQFPKWNRENHFAADVPSPTVG